MGRHAKQRKPGGAKSPRGGTAHLKVSGGGVSYDWVEERGEVKPRCKGCQTVVPLSAWWVHRCPDKDKPPS